MADRRRKPGFGEVLRRGPMPAARKSGGAPAAPSGRKGRRRKGRRRKGRRGKGGASLGPAVGDKALVRKREELSDRFAELQWDLGGIAYELANRNQLGNELLAKQAKELRSVDAELGQIERMLSMGEGGAAGTCPSCGALQARGAQFCWKCGVAQPASGKRSRGRRKSKAKKPSAPPSRRKSK